MVLVGRTDGFEPMSGRLVALVVRKKALVSWSEGDGWAFVSAFFCWCGGGSDRFFIRWQSFLTCSSLVLEKWKRRTRMGRGGGD